MLKTAAEYNSSLHGAQHRVPLWSTGSSRADDSLRFKKVYRGKSLASSMSQRPDYCKYTTSARFTLHASRINYYFPVSFKFKLFLERQKWDKVKHVLFTSSILESLEQAPINQDWTFSVKIAFTRFQKRIMTNTPKQGLKHLVKITNNDSQALGNIKLSSPKVIQKKT